MPAIKECTSAKPVNDFANLADILKNTIPIWQAQKPDSKNTNKTDISGKVNPNVAALPPNMPANPSNYGPLAPYGLPYAVPPYGYGAIEGAYLNRRIEAMHDFTDRVPGKQLHTFPISGNEVFLVSPI
ncbi:MAG: hypothetical protein AABX34_00475 [Nanoarchaeota archaeon]